MANSIYCTKCGGKMEDLGKFCKHCGNPILKQETDIKKESSKNTSIKIILGIFSVCCIGIIVFFIVGLIMSGGLQTSNSSITEEIGGYNFSIPEGYILNKSSIESNTYTNMYYNDKMEQGMLIMVVKNSNETAMECARRLGSMFPPMRNIDNHVAFEINFRDMKSFVIQKNSDLLIIGFTGTANAEKLAGQVMKPIRY